MSNASSNDRNCIRLWRSRFKTSFDPVVVLDKDAGHYLPNPRNVPYNDDMRVVVAVVVVLVAMQSCGHPRAHVGGLIWPWQPVVDVRGLCHGPWHI
eukprot:scaffold7767_cov149-Amphora_coffeaeformis.AAC.3